MALISLMASEDKRARQSEETLFRSMILAVHGDPQKILSELNGVVEEGELPEFAPELSDEEMEEYEPFSAEEVGQTIDLLRRFGVAVS